MYKKDGFITPSEHVNFLAKNLFGACGQIVNGAIAYLAPDGGGPVTPHTHATDHLFIVTQGEAKVLLDGQERIIRENEAFIVKGGIPHSVWNNAQAETVMMLCRNDQFLKPCVMNRFYISFFIKIICQLKLIRIFFSVPPLASGICIHSKMTKSRQFLFLILILIL